MPLIYKYLYSNTPLINEFNKIKTFIIFKLISFRFNRFNVIKKAIKKTSLNECIIKIVIKRVIYISLIKPSFKTITRKKEIKLFDLLRRVEISFLLIKDRCFLKKAYKPCKIKEIRV